MTRIKVMRKWMIQCGFCGAEEGDLVKMQTHLMDEHHLTADQLRHIQRTPEDPTAHNAYEWHLKVLGEDPKLVMSAVAIDKPEETPDTGTVIKVKKTITLPEEVFANWRNRLETARALTKEASTRERLKQTVHEMNEYLPSGK
jgi:hypothetical protein